MGVLWGWMFSYERGTPLGPMHAHLIVARVLADKPEEVRLSCAVNLQGHFPCKKTTPSRTLP